MSLATATSSTGISCIWPFITCITFPVSFSVTSISLGPKNAILVGLSNPPVTFSTTRFLSFTVGPLGDTGAFAYAPYAELIEPVADDVNIIIMIIIGNSGKCLALEYRR